MSIMYFANTAEPERICAFIRPVIAEKLKANPKYGIKIEIADNKRKRSTVQNRYLWAIYKNIVDFYNQTGFLPDDLNLRFINSDFLHEYFKARFDVKQSSKLSTAEFCEYTDKIQHLMIEQSKGEYSPIYPDEPFAEME